MFFVLNNETFYYCHFFLKINLYHQCQYNASLNNMVWWKITYVLTFGRLFIWPSFAVWPLPFPSSNISIHKRPYFFFTGRKGRCNGPGILNWKELIMRSTFSASYLRNISIENESESFPTRSQVVILGQKLD